MYIEEIIVSNYKSLHDFGPVRFGPGINVLVGANNTGKTSLLEVLSLRFGGKPHRSAQTVPYPGAVTEGNSVVTLHVHLDAGETKAMLVDEAPTFSIPTMHQAHDEQRADAFLESLDQPDTFVGQWINGSAVGYDGTSYLESVGALQSGNAFSFSSDRQAREIRFSGQIAGGGTYQQALLNQLSQHIYRFNAERLKIGVAPFGSNRVLAPDASNLAEVLNDLQSNSVRFARFNGYVHAIFPDVGRVAVRPVPGNSQVQILIWPAEEADTEREDLAITLAESGTGIGQVLAILYVLVTADRPQIILIDEPQSFLHPGAVRKLIEILKQHTQHQFIISTHSADIISAASPTTVTLLRKHGAVTTAESVDMDKARELEGVLSAVGARLADVFGADNILWVEGPTEERCFPIILQLVAKRPLLGTRIVGVLHTGDFDTDDPTRTIRIYQGLSRGSSLLPPAVGFIFDREVRPTSKRDDIRRRVETVGGKVAFTPRRMYENYLLHPAALAAVMNSLADFRDQPVTEQEVTEELQRASGETSFFSRRSNPPVGEQQDADWYVEIDGASVLAKLFSQLSEGRYVYDKVRHGLALTEWLADHAPESLNEVADLIVSMLPSS